MMNTHYKDLDGNDVTNDVTIDYHRLVKEGKIDLGLLTVYFCTVAQSEAQECKDAFNSAMYHFAMFMQCDGHLRMTSNRYNTLATANIELVALLTPEEEDKTYLSNLLQNYHSNTPRRNRDEAVSNGYSRKEQQ